MFFKKKCTLLDAILFAKEIGFLKEVPTSKMNIVDFADILNARVKELNHTITHVDKYQSTDQAYGAGAINDSIRVYKKLVSMTNDLLRSEKLDKEVLQVSSQEEIKKAIFLAKGKSADYHCAPDAYEVPINCKC